MFGLGRKYGFFVMVLGAAILLTPVPAFADGAFGGLIASGREYLQGCARLFILHPPSALLPFVSAAFSEISTGNG